MEVDENEFMVDEVASMLLESSWTAPLLKWLITERSGRGNIGLTGIQVTLLES